MLGTPVGDQHIHEIPLAVDGAAAADAVAAAVVGAAGGAFALYEEGRGVSVDGLGIDGWGGMFSRD